MGKSSWYDEFFIANASMWNGMASGVAELFDIKQDILFLSLIDWD